MRRIDEGRSVIKSRFVDQVRFVGAMISSPKTMGAVAPTSAELADLMAAQIDLSSGLPVLELGPGTGAITRAILERGLPPERLYCVEYDPRFCRALRERFPRIHVVQGDAFDLSNVLAESGAGPFDCVVSGLPLLNFDPRMRTKLLQDSLRLVAPGRPFVQFSYGVHAPVENTGAGAGVAVSRSPWVFRNLPPARVWTYTRPAA